MPEILNHYKINSEIKFRIISIFVFNNIKFIGFLENDDHLFMSYLEFEDYLIKKKFKILDL